MGGGRGGGERAKGDEREEKKRHEETEAEGKARKIERGENDLMVKDFMVLPEPIIPSSRSIFRLSRTIQSVAMGTQ